MDAGLRGDRLCAAVKHELQRAGLEDAADAIVGTEQVELKIVREQAAPDVEEAADTVRAQLRGAGEIDGDVLAGGNGAADKVP